MSAQVIDAIVEQNLGVYRASASRLQEDVSQEAQVADDYRGRLVYELLQNADDAMEGQATSDDRVAFLVTDSELWMANSGRPLTEADVQGLCGLGASSKVDAGGSKRASIGHKGLGFKSVLEITGNPSAYSREFNFELGVQHARPHVDRLWQELGDAPPARVPAMRFPAAVDDPPAIPDAMRAEGLNTAFRFPFKESVTAEQRHGLADLLLGLPLTTVLFLKHLESIDVVVDQRGRQLRQGWRVTRSRSAESGWTGTTGLGGSGLYRVTVDSDAGERASFLVAHNEDLPIAGNRVGLSGPAWEGVDLTEVSVAILEPSGGTTVDSMPPEWRRFHVFLPTGEPCPYPMLVNGAFSTDLSRQQVRISTDAGDYNRHLVQSAAELFRDELLPVLLEGGPEQVLHALDRGPAAEPGATAAELFHAALAYALRDVPLLPVEAGGSIAVSEAVVPPSFLGVEGASYRAALPIEARWDGRAFPTPAFCEGSLAGIAADHGADELDAVTALVALARLADPDRSQLELDPSGGFEVDPILELCTAVWSRADPSEREAIEQTARREALFPAVRHDDRTVVRVATEDATAFYPPRSAHSELPLDGLRFMCHSVCWGALTPKERTELLEERMKSWTALFDIREFRFEEVMRAAVLPWLSLGLDEEGLAARARLEDLPTLAAICELAGSQTKPDRPLRYQRLESDRAVFNLSRLPVPCRAAAGTVEWAPAYQVYFGKDWIGEDSIESVLDAVPEDSLVRELVHFRFLAGPDQLRGRLGTFADGTPTDPVPQDGEGALDDEIDVEEDTDQALESDELDRWRSFLGWVGVNRSLRLIHFHDVEDEATGWLTTKDLAQPQGWAFSELGDLWIHYEEGLRSRLASQGLLEGVVPYLYEAHDLDQIEPLLDAASRDKSNALGGRLFGHLARHWPALANRATAKVALVEEGKWPSARSKPQRALADELHDAGDDLWVFRLRGAAFIPTTHGPRLPGATWCRSPEVERRFGRSGQDPGVLLPLLEGEDELGPSARALAVRLGVRAELSPSSFTLEDALRLCRRVEDIYTKEEGLIDASALRRTIKPLYRQLFELLSGRQGDLAAHGALAEAPLLTQIEDRYEFSPARQVIYGRTPGMRERSGVARRVPTFVLEAEPGATAPLSVLFQVRVLEDVLEWEPSPGEPALDREATEAFRADLHRLVPQLLARIRAERSEPTDSARLTRLVERVEAVESLELTCRLDGDRLDHMSDRRYYVGGGPDGQGQAFVVWGPEAWPPTPEAAQGLAMAIADTLGINLVESFLAFIQGDEAQRRQLLVLAGAQGHLPEIHDELAQGEEGEEEDGGSGPPEPERTAEGDDGAGPGRPAPQPPTQSDAPPPPVPLVRFDELVIDGQPITIFGEAPSAPTAETPRSESGGASTSAGAPVPRAAPGTDLDALDELGMRITIAFELSRLARAGHQPVAVAGSNGGAGADSLVVDAHSPAAIKAAEAASPLVKAAFAELESAGLSRLYPGFDILTLAGGQIDRLIELKSSGVDAQVQAMSWNEWKSAANSDVRPRFWLYLVGNLRADLPSRPFVRAIRDPFGTLASQTHEDHQTRRAVQLRVREFREAEHLDLSTLDGPDSAGI